VPKTRDNYRVTGNTTTEIVASMNFLLQRIADRLDRMEGIRGTASIESDLDMNDNFVTEVGGTSLGSDGATLTVVREEVEAGVASHEAEGDPHPGYAQNAAQETITQDWSFKADVKVYDASDNLIHSLE
jgi:hypothetical protein